jgi:hypothetical protein
MQRVPSSGYNFNVVYLSTIDNPRVKKRIAGLNGFSLMDLRITALGKNAA